MTVNKNKDRERYDRSVVIIVILLVNELFILAKQIDKQKANTPMNVTKMSFG